MAQPVTRGDRLRFSVPVFSAMIDQNASVGFLGQNVFYAGIRPEELPISGFVHPPGVMTDLLRPKLRGRFAVQRIEPAGNFLLSAALQIQRIDAAYRFCGFRLNENPVRIFVLPVSEGRPDDKTVFLFLPIACANLFADILRVIVIHQAANAKDQIILLAEGVNSFGYRDHANLMIPQVVDEQRCLRFVAAEAREVFRQDGIDLSYLCSRCKRIQPAAAEAHAADIVIGRTSNDGVTALFCKDAADFLLVLQGILRRIIIA